MTVERPQPASRLRWHLLANSGVVCWLFALFAATLVHRFVPDSRWLLLHPQVVSG